MGIDAWTQFKNAIMQEKYQRNLLTKRTIPYSKELVCKMEMLSDVGYSLNELRKNSNLSVVGASADEFILDGGIIILESWIQYMDLKTKIEHYIYQVTLTTNYEERPEINVVKEYECKAMQQLLIDNDANDSIFSDKNICIQKNKIHIGNYDAYFKTYTVKDHQNINRLLLETYQPITTCSYQNSLLSWGMGDELQVMYNYEFPVYCQFTNGKKIQDFGIDPNNYGDVDHVTEAIDEEIKFYVEAIQDFFDTHGNKHKNSIMKVNIHRLSRWFYSNAFKA